MVTKSKWIWYKGDFEIFHSQKLHLRRTEKGLVFPAFWYIPEVSHNIRIRKTVKLDAPEKIVVTGNGVGFVKINYVKYAFGTEISVPGGEYEVMIQISNPNGLPCVYIEGETIKSDESWSIDNYDDQKLSAGCSDMYTDKDTTPESFFFEYKELHPVKTRQVNGGVLYDYGKEIFAQVRFSGLNDSVRVCYGETKAEALDIDECYVFDIFDRNTPITYAKGFRYIFIPGFSEEELSFTVMSEFLPTERKALFTSEKDILNRIWEVAANTFELNSREFYLDGIKRDRWVWSGDSYQSYFINRYLCFDEDIEKRTITALGGKGQIKQHINTIPDYTFYWLISIYDYYEMTADIDYIKDIFPRMTDFMEFVSSRLDENGFIVGTDADWVFMDWADIDKTGAVCAEQMLFLRSLAAYIACAELLGKECEDYKLRYNELKDKINSYYWNDENGAYIDSFESGKNNVTRHANIFALLFGFADDEKRRSIISNVILNDSIPHITTPYFKFYELEAMSLIGETDYVMDRIIDYWGPMIEAGATSFWEEFSPDIPWQEQLSMYGLKYGKSLCHAWGASPIYLIGRYILGVRPTSPGYETFEVSPQLRSFKYIRAVVPVKSGSVIIEKKDGVISVKATRFGGTLIFDNKEYPLTADDPVTIRED